MTTRRHFLASAAGLLAATHFEARAAMAELPAGPIRIVVGFPPGGGTDVMARLLAARLGDLWKRVVIVENRPGAAGVIASEHAAQQAGDGSSFMMTTISNHALAPSLYPSLRYDPERDFTPVALVGVTPLLLVARPGLGVKTLKDALDLCRARPGELTFGSSGPGSAQHMALELFKLRAKVTATHVPYKGSGPLLNDLAGEHIDMSFETMGSVASFVQSQKVVPIAQTRSRRAASFATVPTMAEAGLAGFEASTWYGLVAPSKTPAALVARVNADVLAVLKEPAVQQRLQVAGAEDGGGTPASFGELIRAERLKWAAVVRDGKVKV